MKKSSVSIYPASQIRVKNGHADGAPFSLPQPLSYPLPIPAAQSAIRLP